MRDRSIRVKSSSAADVVDDGVNVLFSVWLVSRSVASMLDNVLATSGLDADEFAVYSVLAAAPNITPTELARWMAAPPTTVSSYVKRFEARGHVTRESNPGDRRSYRIRLTPAGRRTHSKAAAQFNPALNRVVNVLGEEEPNIRQALLQVRAALDAIQRS